ncbi:MFS transporter, partial [Candidatus Woesebacteria bacterium]|nr:MFS transporter [Candidatus Woesebacteria bacterium]
MKTFYWLLSNALIAGVTNNFVWFALVFWVYLETQSVVATSYLAGIYMIMGGLSGFWFGSIVDHHKKKTAMMVSSIVTLLLFSAGFLYFSLTPEGSFHSIQNTELWVLILLLLTGVTVGNIRNIALPTTVTILVEEGKRDRANG